jgi:hypothetical protein
MIRECSECGSSLPGTKHCCDRAFKRSEAGRKGYETRYENGNVAKPIGDQIADGFVMLAGYELKR